MNASSKIEAHKGPLTSSELKILARLEWQAAVDLGFPHDLADDDREYQARCFGRADEYHARSVDLAKLGK